MSYWPALIFWPAIVAGAIAAGFGIARRQVVLLVGGAALMLPAALYLMATPRFRFIGFVPVVCVLLGAQAVRWNRVWLGSVLVAASVIFWSALASMLVTPLVLHLLVAGAAIGFVASRPVSWKALIYVPGGIVGAFVGALLSFGDAPLLMRYPFLNPWTLSVLSAVIVVAVVRVVEKNAFGRLHRSNDRAGAGSRS